MTSIDPFGFDEEPKLQPLASEGPFVASHALAGSNSDFVFDLESIATASPQPILAEVLPPLAVAQVVGPAVAASVLEDEVAKRRQWKRILLGAVPSWLISLVLHVILIVALALITLEPVSQMMSILQSSGPSESAEIDEFQLDGQQAIETPQEVDDSVTVPETNDSPKMEMAEVQTPSITTLEASVEALDSDSLSSKLINRSLLSSSKATMATMLNSRSATSKSEMLEKFGGSATSEKSVALALKWFAAHQIRSGPKKGAWSFNHNVGTGKPSTGQGDFADSTNGATALALLPFLGAGQTHMEGQYKDNVKAGLAFLIRSMELKNEDGIPCGSWHEKRGNMYSHGLATIAVCEAYAMTSDPDLLQPAQLALNYISVFQDPRGGGWRYAKRQPGDTSVVGWCLMGLKSGRMGNLSVPPASFVRANDFLDFVSTDNGAFYGYTAPESDKDPIMTSVGLLCRMYLGWPKEHPGMLEGVKHLGKVGPKLDNLYYTYYATQVMRHHGGDLWERWNGKLRDPLVALQVTEGTDAGSWEPKGPHSREGGRLYQTALATMILEVYYRHLPLYSDKSLEDEFEI